MPRLDTIGSLFGHPDQPVELHRVLTFESIQIPPEEPTMPPLRLPFAMIVLLFLASADPAQAQVYKWTDANGQVHYGQKKPDDATAVQTLDITSLPPTTPTATDSAAEVARLNALSEQMARERQAAERARQEQALRNLELANRQLQNDLLNQQLQQDQDESDNTTLNDPLFYPYPYPRPYPLYPPKPYPPRPWPCEPWPACRQPTPLPPPRPEPPARPSFPSPPAPAPARITPTPKASFRDQ